MHLELAGYASNNFVHSCNLNTKTSDEAVASYQGQLPFGLKSPMHL